MKKKSIIMISCVLVVVLVLIILITVLIPKGNSNSNNTVIKMELKEPQIEISIEPEDETSGSVTINVIAIANENDEIVSIKLPNNQSVESDQASYEVFKNGEYEFEVESSNGLIAKKSITISNIDEISSDNPYIPDGFEHVEGTTVEDGYIIKDEFENEFVWVPVSDGILIRNMDGSSQYEELDNTASGLYNSVAKYYGFYIARYEASKDEINGLIVARSVYNEMPWSNVKYVEAYNACLNSSVAYDYSGVKTALMNSYAWDTTLNWLNQKVPNYSFNTSYGNYNNGIILKTGNTETDEVNSIFDISGNVREWTTEIYYPTIDKPTEIEQDEVEEEEEEEEKIENYRVVRGGSANLNKVANSRIGQLENMSDVYWGFRMILYKN